MAERWRPSVCKYCGALAIDGAKISYRGVCESCSAERVASAIHEMAANEGETADRWREGRRKAALRLLANDAEVPKAPFRPPIPPPDAA